MHVQNQALVAIIGQPNVGKSTLFNRLTKQKQAITHHESGITRDRHYGEVEWNGKMFTIVDTGGYTDNDDIFDKAIREQIQITLEQAHLILFVVDCSLGLNDYDTSLANLLRKSLKPIFVVVNKIDTSSGLYESPNFYKLGFEHLFPISSINGSGTGELLDAVLTTIAPALKPSEDADLPHIAIIGKPNVGKSSLLNTLLGQNRSIVTDLPGTTRDSIHEIFNQFGLKFVLTDTAGLRKKAKIKYNIEFYALLRTLKAIHLADVCILMIDVMEGITSQDLHIIQHIEQQGKGIILMANKWDLWLEKDQQSIKKLEKSLYQRLRRSYIPLVFASVLEKKRILKILQKALQIQENRQKRISTALLNKHILPEIEKTPPPAFKNKYIHIKYIVQLPTKRLSFALFCNFPQYVPNSYKNFLINRLRFHFDLQGLSIEVVFRKK